MIGYRWMISKCTDNMTGKDLERKAAALVLNLDRVGEPGLGPMWDFRPHQPINYTARILKYPELGLVTRQGQKGAL